MTHDALIVGAGPAGATLAGLLARQGARVLLADRARFPRPKPCGECLNPGALAALHRLGLWEAVAPLAPVTLTGWSLQAGGRRCDLDFPPGRFAAAVDRLRFDHALVQWAARQGAEVAEGLRVDDLLREGAGRVTGARAGQLTLPAAVTVGADGLHSVVTRRLGLRAPPPGRGAAKVALTAHWHGVGGLTDRGELHALGPAVLGIAKVSAGGEANVVLVVPAAQARGLTQREFLGRWPRFARARLVTAALGAGPFDRPVTRVTVPGALLIGDAAGYFDPFTGQGIYHALRSAELAAAAILHGAPYEQPHRTEFGPSVRRQRLVDGVVRRPGALAAAVWCLGRCPLAGRHLLKLLGDCPAENL